MIQWLIQGFNASLRLTHLTNPSWQLALSQSMDFQADLKPIQTHDFEQLGW